MESPETLLTLAESVPSEGMSENISKPENCN